MMWSSIELREMRVFLVLAEELHFRRTAERLHVTPARVSQVLRDLERKTGAQLVARTSREVRLTPFGQRFRREAGAAYRQFMGTLEQLDADGQREPALRLGLFSVCGVATVASVVKAFEKCCPGRGVEVTESPVGDVYGALRRGDFDLVWTWLPHGQADLVDGLVLQRDSRVLAVASDHPLASRDKVSVEDLADYQVVHVDTIPDELHDVWIPAATPSGRPIPRREFGESSQGAAGRMVSELLCLIITGQVVHPTMQTFADIYSHPRIVYIPIHDMPPIPGALAWHRHGLRPGAHAFLAAAREVAGADLWTTRNTIMKSG